MQIVVAEAGHLAAIAGLFDQYRMFYQQTTDLPAAQRFIADRLQQGDSAILMAINDAGEAIGFTQLYPSFSSVSMQRTWILNDLFVAASHRRQGVAKLLMQAAADYAQRSGAVRITLATQISNQSAQHLYESLGYAMNQDFYYYALSLI
jgi:ribosomal protein S18 acetylase RimI-like enzyme